jgi:hypothetical protein
MAADVTKSIVHSLEDLFLNSTVGVKGFFQASVAATTPSEAAVDGTGSVDVTVTGVALGDIVLGVGVTAALPTNQIYLGAQVSATNTVTLTFGSNGVVTGASRTFKILVADVT